MPLAQLPLDRDVHVIADWFEFYVLNSEYTSANFHDIQRMWDRRRNAEDATPEGRSEDSPMEDGDEQFLEEVLTEIRTRVQFLGDAYPFDFSDSEEALILKSKPRVGHVVYLFCLLLSNVDNSEIFELDRFSYKLDNNVRDLFQACATWAAAKIVNGSACSFGFPRPDGTGFLEKLRQVYAIVGEGQVRDHALPGVSSSPKDEGIDVIAWAHRADAAPGRHYVLGQVATGRNWPDKSVVEYIKPFHENWFSNSPASHPTPALFIPRCIDQIGDATLVQQIHILTKRYGDVYYRYLMPQLADRGFELAQTEKQYSIERTGDFAEIQSWVADTIVRMRKVETA